MTITASQKHYRKYKESRMRGVVEYTRRKRRAVLDLLGSKCAKCGFSDPRALQVDHINGGGKKDLNKKQGGNYWNRVIRSFLSNENKYQLLCANCNWIKRVENREIRKSKLS